MLASGPLVIFLEAHSRLLLVLHTIVGGTVVASATHLVVWTRGYWRGNFSRHKGVKRFAWIVACAYAAQLALGLLIYPVYKVHVRIGYFDDPTASMQLYETTQKISRWFDVKEHAIGVGFAVALALLWIVSSWKPKQDGEAIGPVVAGMALVVAAAVWFAAIVGIVTVSFRSIGT